MTTLDEIRARSAKAIADMNRTLPKYDKHFPYRASARDVPDLIVLLDALTPLVQVARDFVHGAYDMDTLERLIDVSDKLPWPVLDALGITEEDE